MGLDRERVCKARLLIEFTSLHGSRVGCFTPLLYHILVLLMNYSYLSVRRFLTCQKSTPLSTKPPLPIPAPSLSLFHQHLKH
jgi:hypothetical protein